MTKPLGSFGAAASQNAALQAYLGRRRKEKILDLVLPIFGVAGLLVFWWAVVKGFHVRPFIAPSPLLVATSFAKNHTILFGNLLPTAVEAVGGFLIGNMAAIAVAILFVHVKALRQIFFPVAVMLNSIPVVAKAPILILIMGSGLAPKTTIAAFVCFFPTLVNMLEGLGSVDPQVMELMEILQGSFLQLASISVLLHENRGLYVRDRRSSRRVDWIDQRHRRADPASYLCLRYGVVVFRDPDEHAACRGILCGHHLLRKTNDRVACGRLALKQQRG